MLIYDAMTVRKTLEDFHRLCGVRVSFFDPHLTQVAAYPNLGKFCQMVRRQPKGAARCRECEMESLMVSSQNGHPLSSCCHMELTVAVEPVFDGEQQLGYLRIDQCREVDAEKHWKRVRKRAAEFMDDPDSLYESYLEIWAAPREDILAAIRLLGMCLANIYHKKELSQKREESFSTGLQKYIQDNFRLPDKMRLSAISDHFNVSNSTVCHLCKKELGITVAQVIRRCRVNAAKRLLCTTTLSVNEVSAVVGIPDSNYFTKVFKVESGFTPSRFRSLALEKEQEQENGRVNIAT